MPPLPDALRRAQLTGNRIRERRLSIGLKQAALAERAGISPSYLNLIEHNRRRIGGRLLVAIARALEVEPATLSEGADATLYDSLQTAAQRAGSGPKPETDRIDELAARFPGWTHLVAQQGKQISVLEALAEGLRDRLTHDPILAESMHEVLSTVAAIRSTADILVRDPDIDPAWRTRFHRNLHEEAERLSTRATAMIAHFEDQGSGSGPARAGTVSTPTETVEAMFDAADHHFPVIEAEGDAAVARILQEAAGMDDPASFALGRALLERYASDAVRLPLEVIQPAAAEAGFDPARLLGLGGGDVALVLRRLASLPRVGPNGAPEFGLAVCDGSGALIFRRRVAGFSIPRFGFGCPLWPLYRALGRPGQPESAEIELPQGARFRAWAVSQPLAPTGFGEAPVMQATMLLTPSVGTSAQAPILAGPGCHMCPRTACSARR